MVSPVEALRARSQGFSAFADHRRLLVSGPELGPVLAAAQHALRQGQAEAATVFHDPSGRRTEVGQAEAEAEVLGRIFPEGTAAEPGPSGPGRPRLGVVSREVSLLPRHWDWLAAQRGGASAALRRLVDEARKGSAAREAARLQLEGLDRALTALAGDQPGFEAVLRALYAKDFKAAAEGVAVWPHGLGAHFQRLIGQAEAWQGLVLDEVSSHKNKISTNREVNGNSISKNRYTQKSNQH